MKRRTHYNALIAATLISAFALSACGIRGELKTPPPIWGEDNRTEKQKAEDAKDDTPQGGILIDAPEPVE